MTVSVEIINQLNDNYSYLISSKENNSSIIIDPAEADKILDILKKKKLILDYTAQSTWNATIECIFAVHLACLVYTLV